MSSRLAWAMYRELERGDEEGEEAELCISAFCDREHNEKTVFCKTGSWSLSDTRSASTLIFKFSDSRNYEELICIG